MAASDKVLLVPGLHNSGPLHWQSQWELKHPEYARVAQRDWESPQLDEWAAALDAAIRDARGRVLLVAHSFGCLAALRRIAARPEGVAGALLVAPADPARFGLSEALFSGMPGVPLVFAASRNDPWLAFDRAAGLARGLDAELVDLGEAGHVNAASGYGPWPEGERLLAALRSRVAKRERALHLALAFAAF